MPEMLELRGLSLAYGRIRAVEHADIDVARGEIVALVGANGAGKTTTLLALSGLVRPASGAIRFAGHDLRRLGPPRIVELGLAHVPEGRAILPQMSVQENLAMGAYTRTNANMIKDDLDFVYRLFPRLQERRDQKAGTLSGGEQQMLAMGRALMSSPKVLLMDEPSMGLAPVLVEVIFDSIEQLNKSRGITVLLVEQNAQMALQVANRAYVLETGRITMSGDAKALLNDEKVISAYLGL